MQMFVEGEDEGVISERPQKKQQPRLVQRQ